MIMIMMIISWQYDATAKTRKNRYRHLTNYAVNKNSKVSILRVCVCTATSQTTPSTRTARYLSCASVCVPPPHKLRRQQEQQGVYPARVCVYRHLTNCAVNKNSKVSILCAIDNPCVRVSVLARLRVREPAPPPHILRPIIKSGKPASNKLL